MRILTTVWGTSFDDVSVASVDGAIFHFDGSQWKPMYDDPEQNFWGMWGSSPSNITAVGDWGVIVGYAKE